MKSTGKGRSIKIKIIIGFSVAVIFVLVAGVIAYKSLVGMTSTVNRLSEPNYKLMKMQQLLIDLSKAESSIRKYTLDKNRQSLDPYFSFLNDIENNIDTLSSLTKNNIRQSELVDSLTILLARKINIFSELINIKDKEDENLVSNQILSKLNQGAIENTPPPAPQKTIRVQPKKETGVFKRFKNVFKGDKEINPIKETSTSKNENTANAGEIKKIITEAKKEEINIREAQRGQELILLQKDMEIMYSIQNIMDKLQSEELIILENERTSARKVSHKTTVIIATIIFAGTFCTLIILFLIFNDITRAGRYRVELLEAKHEAEKLARMKEQLLANMSHEIRTPLNSILGFSEQLKKTSLDAHQQKFLNAVHKSSELLLATVNDILNFSKLDAGKLQMEEIPFYLEDIVQESIHTFELKADEKGIKLQCHLDEGLKQVLLGDPFRLKQILINLLNNGIKFTDQGMIEVICSVVTEKEKEIFAKIDVKDTGIGISKDKLQTIFEEFTQADTTITRKYGGTGLGLTIVKRITELYGGNISVTSKEGKGSVFTVMMPFKKAGKYTRVIKEGIPVLDLSMLEGKAVLLVDDDEMNRLLGKTILDGWNVKTTLAINGNDAIEKIKKANFDIVLMDLHMPDMSGIDVTMQIRSMPGGKSAIPVIAVTANIIKEDLDKCIKGGMDDYLLKPFKENELYNKITKNLRINVTKNTNENFNDMSLAVNNNSENTPSNNALYNLDEIKEIAGEEHDFTIKLLETFVKSASEGMREMNDSLTQNRLENVGAIAHKLLPSFKHLAIQSAVPQMQMLEKLIKGNGNPETAPADVEHVSKITETVISELRKEIQTLKKG